MKLGMKIKEAQGPDFDSAGLTAADRHEIAIGLRRPGTSYFRRTRCPCCNRYFSGNCYEGEYKVHLEKGSCA